MRSLDDARVAWDAVRQYQSLRELKQAVRLEDEVSIATAGGRSLCWKVFLIFEELDSPSWIRTLASTRSAYNSLRAHFLRQIDDAEDATGHHDPLSGETDLRLAKSSPWAQLRKDEELRGEILQDVVRCMPENLYFRKPDSQRILTDILFIFCKLNPDIGYRQGMHELLAPILWVVERDAIDLGQSSKALGEDAVVQAMFDAEHVEHDTFALFGQLMQSAKSFYEQTSSDGKENPMVARSRRIFHDMLPMVDEKLASHLQRIDIIPQVFLIRWIRLLFGREFGFDGMLTLWDVIFAEDPALEVVDHICLAMLLRIRWDLIDADYNVALTLLLRYPEPETQLPAQAFALDGLYLREHMDRHSGSYLVAKYSGRPIVEAGRPVTPPALQRNITTFSGQLAAKTASAGQTLSPSQSPRPTRNFEAVLSSTARNLYARGEKLGIGKAVRNAVDEVHKRAQEIRDAQTPATPPFIHQRAASRSSFGSAPLLSRISALEARSKQLAELLDGAVHELWDYQKNLSEQASNGKTSAASADLERLSVAIAKVQFIQVYLADPSMPLAQQPDEAEPRKGWTASNETPPSNVAVTKESTQHESQTAPLDEKVLSERTHHSVTATDHDTTQVAGLADPASFDESLTDSGKTSSPRREKTPQISVQSPSEPGATAAAAEQHSDTAKSASPSSRPRLEQSSFSWMLGKEGDSEQRPFHVASPLPPDQGRAKGALFQPQETMVVSKKAKRRGSSGSKQRKKTDAGPEPAAEEEAFDLGGLKHSKVRK